MTKATPEDPCTSKVCRSRLYCINEYVKSLHTHLRTLWSDLVAAGVKTDRDIQHMTFLQKFQKGRQGSVSDGDIEKIMAGTDSDTFFNLQDEDGSEAGNLADKEGSESLKAESVSSNNLSSDESM
ncbi:hypothetical protein M413DRAFT_450139 [Hebeloma cylindrosporum]|uniref:Uncharacterized protein n=1 Tax=Hebeloma cylindrosporum TaxID=76867 RepID=A0A0C3BCV2_HEBCY|nr:hypothetical protein M413DRAFT_450139 [Hebeloma cylindrosporum h7]